MSEVSDVLAYIVLTGTDALAAECGSALTANDKSTLDFEDGKFFEAENFSFGVSLADDEPGQGGIPEATDDAPREERSFARWRRLSPAAGTTGTDQVAPPYRVQPNAFTLDRYIDAASPVLAQNCLLGKKFVKLVVVKRVVTGRQSLVGVLRFEFTAVSIQAIGWSDGDMISESFSFLFKDVTVKYWKRNAQGVPQTQFVGSWVGPV